MNTFGDVAQLLNQMKGAGVMTEYAIAGAMAVTFWTEPVATRDLDVVITPPPDTHALDPLRPLFEWLGQAGIELDGEHAMIAGVPVQFLIAWSPLVEEAVSRASDLSYDPSDPRAPTLRLISPTYLVAMWAMDPAADTPRRRERAAMLREAGLVDERLLKELVARFTP